MAAGEIATTLAAELAPLLLDEDQDSGELLAFCDALMTSTQEVADLVQGDVEPFDTLFDPMVEPPKWLGWMGQFRGVTLLGTDTTDQQRWQILNATQQQRGQALWLRAQIQKYLTGTRYCLIVERSDSGDATHSIFGVVIRADESAALTPQQWTDHINGVKVAGDRLDYLTQTNYHTYVQSLSSEPTYANRLSAWALYSNVPA